MADIIGSVIAENAAAGLVLAVKTDVTTRDIEAWMKAVRGYRPADGKTSRFEDHAITLRGAIKSGLIIEPQLSAAQVEALPPAHVRFYGEALERFYGEVTTVPLA